MRINSKLDQIERLNELAMKCTQAMTGMPHNPNRGGSHICFCPAMRFYIVTIKIGICSDGFIKTEFNQADFCSLL